MSSLPAWINGSFDNHIDAGDRGLTLGDGVFDTLVAFNKIPFAGDEHLARLCAQAGAIGIRLDSGKVHTGWSAVLDRLGDEPLILRTTVTRGTSGRGLWPQPAPAPTLIITAAPWSRELLGTPTHLVTSTVTRDPGSPSSRLKSLGYLDAVLAARQAAERGADDAMLLTPSGRVSCTTIANLFIATGQRLVTPPLSDAVQPGILRGLVLAAAESVGLIAEERSLTPREVADSDEVFTTNSVRFLRPCLSLDGAALSQNGGGIAVLRDALRTKVLDACDFDLTFHQPIASQNGHEMVRGTRR